MAKTPRPWIVTRHDPLEQLEENLWAVHGDVPGFPRGCGIGRRMSIVKLSDGRLVFYNAVPLDDATLAQVRALGTPSILIAPIALHTMDAHAFQEKLGLQTFTSQQSLAAVHALIPAARSLDELPKDPSLRCVPLSGTRFGEAALVVQSGARATLLLCDCLHNSAPGSGFNGRIFQWMGFTGEKPTMPPMFKWRAVRDRAALKKDLLALADTPGLVRLVPSHGGIITQEPAQLVREVVRAAL